MSRLQTRKSVKIIDTGWVVKTRSEQPSPVAFSSPLPSLQRPSPTEPRCRARAHLTATSCEDTVIHADLKIHTHAHTLTHKDIHRHTYSYIYRHIHRQTHSHTRHTYRHIHTVHTCTDTYTNIYTLIHTHIHRLINTHIHRHIHINTHIHTWGNAFL